MKSQTLTSSMTHYLGKTHSQLLSVLRTHPKITISQLAPLLQVSQRTIERHLRQLQAEGKIERVGSRRTGVWRVL